MTKRLNIHERRERKAAELQLFVQKYGRKAQRGVEPNDRSYSRNTERLARRLPPLDLDSLLRDGEEEAD